VAQIHSHSKDVIKTANRRRVDFIADTSSEPTGLVAADTNVWKRTHLLSGQIKTTKPQIHHSPRLSQALFRCLSVLTFVANDNTIVSLFQDFSGVTTKKRHIGFDRTARSVDFSRKPNKNEGMHISSTWAVIQ
jgi:hypothetical protein